MKLSEKFRKAPRFLTIEKYLRPIDRPVASHKDARLPLIVPLVNIDYGSLWARIKQMRYVGSYLLKSVVLMAKGAKSIKKNPYTGQTKITEDFRHKLEEYAKSLGVSDIGYTVVDTRYIFKDFRILFKNAIVFAVEMDEDKIAQSPNIISFVEVFKTYYQVGYIVNKVADFLRENGYNAHAGPAVGGDVNYVPIAIDSGIGYSGKNGLLITRKNGARVRLGTVFTDIENLPFSQENPYKWIRDYCTHCNICINKCPAGAIYQEPIILEDGGPTFIDHKKCAEPFTNDNGCSLCIKYCPFSKSGMYDKLKHHYENHQIKNDK